MKTKNFAGKTCHFFASAAADAPLFVTCLDKHDIAPTVELLSAHFDASKNAFNLLILEEENWESAFTPWQAAAVFKKAPDFAGKADEYFALLTEEILPQMQQEYGLNPAHHAWLGYSLAGLFGVYTAYQYDFWHKIAAVSASLWFDNFLEFAQNHAVCSRVQRAYFSVGEQEKNSKNPRLAKIEDNLLAVCTLWQQQGIAVQFERNAGGHFQDVPQRLLKAINYLLQP
ncbi:MAG: alpha/beta hydrolase-fold protein [Neisseria sp.]|nr:alpha/beta hydrolase-fold protein [Neisseria sp.]